MLFLLLLLRKSLHFRIEREREGVEGGEGSEAGAGGGGGERYAERVGKGLCLGKGLGFRVGKGFRVDKDAETFSRRQGHPQKENLRPRLGDQLRLLLDHRQGKISFIDRVRHRC